MTNTEVITLRDNNQLEEGQSYTITNYENFNVILTADSPNTFLPVATNNSGFNIHYLLDDNSIDYMQDPINNIEGYFDWTDNVEGTNSNIYFENSKNLFVEDCDGIYSNNVSSGSITDCTDIIIGDNNTLTLSNCNHITIENNNTLSLSSCDNCTFGNNNILMMNTVDSVLISDSNEDLTVTGINIVGSKNVNIDINGSGNFIGSNNIEIEITGNCNSTNNTKYFVINGSFNSIVDSTFSNIENSFGNEISNSNSIDITDTNNNVLKTDNLELNDKPAFLQYRTNMGVRSVTNLVDSINLQSDDVGTILKIDQAIFTDDISYNTGKKYQLDSNGEWEQVI